MYVMGFMDLIGFVNSEHSFLHGIFEISSIIAAICMGSMPSRDFVNVWYGFCRILNDLLMYGMGCMNIVWFLNVWHGFCWCLCVCMFVCLFVCPSDKMIEKVGPFHQFWDVSLNLSQCVWVLLILYVLLMYVINFGLLVWIRCYVFGFSWYNMFC